jgi:hypothetical protein
MGEKLRLFSSPNEAMPLSSQATASPLMMQDIDLQGVA